MQLKPFLLDTESSWRVQRASLIFPSSGVCARGHGDFQSTASGHIQLFTNLMDCFHQSSNYFKHKPSKTPSEINFYGASVYSQLAVILIFKLGMSVLKLWRFLVFRVAQ